MNVLERGISGLVFIARGAAGAVLGNLGLALLSLVMALSLWLFVTERENPKEVQAFNSSIPVQLVNVPEGLAVANVGETGVRIRIEAPKSEIDGLRADDFEATLDLGGLDRGAQSVAVDVTPPNSRISVVQITPARIDVSLESRRSREVPVQISAVGSPVTGFQVVDQQVEPERVTVSGPESLVELVDGAVAVVNLTGQRVDVNERIELEARDANGGGISRVTIAPDSANVTIDVERRDYSLQFAVNPTITGAPAAGYNIAAVTVEPRLVSVTAPLDVLQSIDVLRGIGTDEISIADARDDVIRTVELALPAGASVEGPSTVRVTVDIAPQTGEFTFVVVPRVRNLGTGLAVTPAGPIAITLSGDVPSLEGLDTSSIAASVDAQGLGPGLYTVPVVVSPPAGTTIVRFEPPELGIAITLRP